MQRLRLACQQPHSSCSMQSCALMILALLPLWWSSSGLRYLLQHQRLLGADLRHARSTLTRRPGGAGVAHHAVGGGAGRSGLQRFHDRGGALGGGAAGACWALLCTVWRWWCLPGTAPRQQPQGLPWKAGVVQGRHPWQVDPPRCPSPTQPPPQQDQGAEVVVALTHMRLPNDLRLAEAVPGIDLVLGGVRRQGQGRAPVAGSRLHGGAAGVAARLAARRRALGAPEARAAHRPLRPFTPALAACLACSTTTTTICTTPRHV